MRPLTCHRGTPIEVVSRSRPPPKPVDRLPQISYGLMKDQALRKKLADLGIPNGGPRPLLIKRHTEWVNLVNSNCDSSKPRSKRELLSELDIWERSQGRNILNGLGGSETNSVMRKDFDGAAWAVSHGNEFQQLIARARQKPKAMSEGSAQVNGTNPIPPDGEASNSETPATEVLDQMTDQPQQDISTPPDLQPRLTISEDADSKFNPVDGIGKGEGTGPQDEG